MNGNAAGCTAQGSRYLSLQRVCDCSRRKTFPRKDVSHCSSAPRQADLCSRGAPPSFCSHALNNFFYSSSLRVSAADSGPVSTSFCMFFVCFVFLQVQVQHFLCGLASTLKRNQIRTFLRALLSHTQQKKKKDGCASASHVANAVPFCLTGAQSVPEHVWCQWRNAGPFISGITLDG